MSFKAVNKDHPRFSRAWMLICSALVLALGISVVVFVKAPASPVEPQAVPLPVPLPLSRIPIPEPPDLDEYVLDRAAAIRLGKALFWDMQVGSDGTMACASCHFHAGADGRTQNSIHPGPDEDFEAALPNQVVDVNNFPFHDRNLPDFQNSIVTRDFDDIHGSQGVRSSSFVDIVPGQAEENSTLEDDPMFQVDGTEIRRVTSRNAPTVINAVYNFDNLWDGSAHNIFNGVNPHGASDPDASVFVSTPDGIQPVLVRIRNAALASQAVGPPMNGNEMSAAGRTFPKLGKKMLTLAPLDKQLVSNTDSVLGPLASTSGTGLTTTYADMIRAAFQPKWWSNLDQIITYEDGVPVISPHPGGSLTTDQFTQMEANFSLFFGLSIQLYEATLVSDDSPFDQVMEGARAFTPIEEVGFALFNGECAVCHAGTEFTTAAHTNVSFGQGGPPPLVELMLNTGFVPTIYDDGYFNIGVTRTTDDISRGALDPFNMPLSYSRLGRQKELGQIPPHYEPYVWDLPPNATGDLYATVNGAFKAPTLRNIELTGPYFHNGGVATLDQLVDFYTRGGNFPDVNQEDLDPQMIEIPELQNHPELHAALITFLHTLTDERVRFEQAPFDHPELFVPVGAAAGDLTTDELLHIPAVGASGREIPIEPFIPTSNAPVVIPDVFEVPFGSTNVVLNVLLNDGDLDGQPIFVTSVVSPTLNGGAVVVGPEGATIEYSAPAGFDGNDTITYTVSDGSLTTQGLIDVAVQRAGMNRPPEAAFDLLPVVQINGVGVAVPVLANDQDLDGNPIFITSVTNVTHGTAVIDPVGDQILFTPEDNFSGFATLTYTISDGVAEASAQALLKVNNWPIAYDDTFEVRADSANNALTVLNNDVDTNADDILTVLAFEQTFKGTAVIDATGFYISYTPLPGATGIERFSYFVGDGIVADSATVTIYIKPNSLPLLVNDSYTVPVNSTDNVLVVLENDSDEDGDALTITTVTDTDNGEVRVEADNSLLYTPVPGFHGKDTFYYTAVDGHGGVNTAKVTVNVVLTQKLYIPLLTKP